MFIKDIVNSTLHKLKSTNKPVTRDSIQAPSAPAGGVSTRPRIIDPEAAQEREAQGYADLSMENLNRDISASNQLGQQKIAEKTAPIPKVSGWRRALYGALSSIATKNPKDDWGEILGAGIGGGAVNAASERVYETGMRRDRNAQIDEQYRDREEELGRQTDADRKLAELSRVRLGDIDRRLDRKEGREIQRENAATRRDQTEYQKILKETAQTSLDAYRKNQDANDKARIANDEKKIEARAKEVETINRIRQSGIQLRQDANTETRRHNLETEAISKGKRMIQVAIPITVNGEEVYRNHSVPEDEDPYTYLQKIYGAKAPIMKGARKVLNRPVTNPVTPANKASNSGETFNATRDLAKAAANNLSNRKDGKPVNRK